MSKQERKLTCLVEEVESLVDQLKTTTLNLTIANAKLRLKDNAFQATATQFGEMLDGASEAYEEAERLLKKIRGDMRSGRDNLPVKDIDSYVDRIRIIAEQIIRTVMAIKGMQHINREI